MATFFVKRDYSGKYYWILRSDKNYKIVARSSESYDSIYGAYDSVDWTKANAENSSVVDETK